MHAIYAFCREVDDIADEPGDAAAKLQALAAWREEIARLYAGHPTRPTTKELLESVRRFDLPEHEFLAVIDGMEIDSEATVRMDTLDDLLDYCRKVAGAVGMLSVHVFGVPGHPGPRIAEALGTALQITNILRDLKEDANRKRVYLPVDLLRKHGVATEPPAAILAAPGLADVCSELIDLARGQYACATDLLMELGWRKMRPAALMMAVYRALLDRLEHRGWNRIDEPVQLSQVHKLSLALRYGVF